MEFFKANIIPGEVLVQIIAFLAVFWILKHFAWKPILNALDSRRERIRLELEQIEQAKKEIEALRQDYTTHLHKIEEEARAKIQEAIQEGRSISREIQESARAASQEKLEKAKQNIELEIEKARITLRREIANLAIQVSEKVVGEAMTDSKQQQKILEIIEQIERES